MRLLIKSCVLVLFNASGLLKVELITFLLSKTVPYIRKLFLTT
jgi:hypothetical protein